MVTIEEKQRMQEVIQDVANTIMEKANSETNE